MAKPIVDYDWANNDIIDPVSGQNNKEEPTTIKKNNGWIYLEKPKFNWFNYWMNAIKQWIDWIINDPLEGVFTFLGIKTFDSIPILPNSDPISDNQAVRKKYVDDGNYMTPYIQRQIGNTFTFPLGPGNPDSTRLTSNMIALVSVTPSSQLRTYQFYGTDWSLIGNAFALPVSTAPKITRLTSSRVVVLISTSNQMIAYDFNGTDWSQVGNAYNFSTPIGSGDISILSSNRIALVHNNDHELRTYDFNGTNWVQVGNSLNIQYNASIASLSSTRIVLYLASISQLRTYDFNGTNWSQVGNSLSISVTAFPKITELRNDHILLFDQSQSGFTYNLRTYNFNGTNWSQVGNKLYVSGIGANSITAMSSAWFVIISDLVRTMQTYKIDWNNVKIPFQKF